MTDPAALARAWDALQRGEYLLAYDEAQMAAQNDDDPAVRYLAVLALARAGAVDRAAEELAASGLQRVGAFGLSPQLAEDIAALGARLAKDRALAARPADRGRLAAEAALRYEAIYRELGRPYSCINAATMWLFAGDAEQAARLARTALALVAEPPADPVDDYWFAATAAEAALVLCDVAAAADALRRAGLAALHDLAARASTRRQLALVCQQNRIDPVFLDEALPVPLVLHYCGHLGSPTGGRFPAEEEPRVAAEVTAFLEARRVGFAYGSLASGADILVAEAVLASGAELHVILPFPADEFVAVSVAPAGDGWPGRFEACLGQATTVTLTDGGPFLGDDTLFEYCARVAMGRARIRAAFISSQAHQLAIWDGQPSAAAVGTAADIAAWAAGGGSTHIVQSRTLDAAPPAGWPVRRRQLRAVLFADIKGFSTFHDGQMAAFVPVVLDPMAGTLARYDDHILSRRTWGDGLHVVFTSLVPAAHCALDLQATMARIPWEEAGFNGPVGLRIGVHVGPVIETYDPIRAGRDFTGAHIVRTARVEPRTPPGQVYVTEQFAALLALEVDTGLSCQYVGHIPSAKEYGTFPMYLLTRIHDRPAAQVSLRVTSGERRTGRV